MPHVWIKFQKLKEKLDSYKRLAFHSRFTKKEGIKNLIGKKMIQVQ